MKKLAMLKAWFLKSKKNKHFFVPFIFIFFVLFLGVKLLLVFWENESVIKALKKEKNYYEVEIVKLNSDINALKNDKAFEKFVREEYYMNKQGEDVYLFIETPQ